MNYPGPERRRPPENRRHPVRSFGQALREFGTDPTPEARWHHVWRDFVPLIALLIAAYAVLSVENKVDQATVNATVAKKVADSQRQGRRVATGIICGALAGVQDAGRLVLTDRLPGTRRFRQPSTAKQQRIRRVYARAYNEVITARIVAEAGVATGERVTAPNGTVNCDAIRVAAGTQPPP
jgi:hypothetical protein